MRRQLPLPNPSPRERHSPRKMIPLRRGEGVEAHLPPPLKRRPLPPLAREIERRRKTALKEGGGEDDKAAAHHQLQGARTNSRRSGKKNGQGSDPRRTGRRDGNGARPLRPHLKRKSSRSRKSPPKRLRRRRSNGAEDLSPRAQPPSRK